MLNRQGGTSSRNYPGMGDDESSLAAVNRLIEETPNIPKVIDADAIKALNGWPKS